MAEPAIKRFTLADLETPPEGVGGELIEGVLYTFPRPRPRPRHARAASGFIELFDVVEIRLAGLWG